MKRALLLPAILFLATFLLPSVSLAADDAKLISIEVPASVEPGELFVGRVRLKNTGDTTWNLDTHALMSESSRLNNRWSTNQLMEHLTVEPGEEGYFQNFLRAPSTRGSHVFAWRMREASGNWFGEVAVTNIKVGATAAFTPGDIVVTQLGDNIQSISTNGTPVYIKSYSRTGGLPRFQVGLPTVGSNALIIANNVFSGRINRTADKRQLVFAGYNTNLPNNLLEITNSPVPRAIGTIDAFGNFKIAVRGESGGEGSPFRGGNIRKPASDGRGNFWVATQTHGIVYLRDGAAPFPIWGGGNQLVRDLELIGGKLFFSSPSFPTTNTSGIVTFGGAPTTIPLPPSLMIDESPRNIPGFVSASGNPRGFAINPEMTIAYVADARGFQNGAGLFRFNRNDVGGWTYAYRLTNDLPVSITTGNVFDEIAVDFSGPNPTIAATTLDAGENVLLLGVDTGPNSTFKTIATADLKTTFLGVTFAPLAGPQLSMSGNSQNLTLTFDSGVLETSPTIFGDWTDVTPRPTSPYVIQSTGQARFYRLREEN